MQLYIKGLLDGLALPVAMGGAAGAGGGDRLTAIVTPPVVDYRTTPRAYIWGSAGIDDARTMPHPGSFRTIQHKIDVWVICYADIDVVASEDSNFPSVLEAVMHAIRVTEPIPVLGLLDTVTGRTSDIQALGQKMTWDYAPVKLTDGQSSIARFDGRIVIHISEWLRS